MPPLQDDDPSSTACTSMRRRLLQGDERLASKVLHQCRLYGLNQEALSVCRQMGVHHWQAGHTAAALSWFIRGKNNKLYTVWA